MKTRLQVLCVAMGQNDLSLAEKLNVSSDLIIANQAERNDLIEETFPWGTVKMVSTNTQGVGKNRNTAFLYADGEILLLSDDDIVYSETYAEEILSEFDSHPEADVMIFNITSSNSKREQKQNYKTKKIHRFNRLPYGGPRIAIRRTAWEKSNVWFTTLFGGGSKYTNGEDSLFLTELRKKRLAIYVSSHCIGQVNMDNSTWFKGPNEEFFFNKGAFCAAAEKTISLLYAIYFALRVRSFLSIRKKIYYFIKGVEAYKNGKGFDASLSETKER